MDLLYITLKIFIFQAERQFNYDLCSSRSRIEHAFGLLKGKWRKLRHIEIVNHGYLSDIIISACVLHNFLIDWKNGNAYGDEDELDEDEVDEESEEDEADEENVEDENEADGIRRRQRILINYELID